MLLAVATLVFATALLCLPSTSPADGRHDTPSSPIPVEVQAPVIPARAVPRLDELPTATTFSTLAGAPADVNGDQAPSGEIVHPDRAVPVYSQPGGTAIAVLPTQQVSSDTWVPVIADEPGWVQVLLPSRPNSSTGWLSTQDGSLAIAQTPFRIVVDRAQFRLSLYRDDALIGSWTVGIGKPQAPTPAGRTFVLASIQDSHQSFSPVILPLGIHSASHETFGGGPGTTGIHGWPSPAVFGQPSSDGCIRVPADALHVLATDVPLGSPVLIT